MREKQRASDWGSLRAVNDLLGSLISISIMGAAFLVVMLVACITALCAASE